MIGASVSTQLLFSVFSDWKKTLLSALCPSVCQMNYSYICGPISTGVRPFDRAWPTQGWTLVPAFPRTGTRPKCVPNYRNVIEEGGFFKYVARKYNRHYLPKFRLRKTRLSQLGSLNVFYYLFFFIP